MQINLPHLLFPLFKFLFQPSPTYSFFNFFFFIHFSLFNFFRSIRLFSSFFICSDLHSTLLFPSFLFHQQSSTDSSFYFHSLFHSSLRSEHIYHLLSCNVNFYLFLHQNAESFRQSLLSTSFSSTPFGAQAVNRQLLLTFPHWLSFKRVLLFLHSRSKTVTHVIFVVSNLPSYFMRASRIYSPSQARNQSFHAKL